VALNPNLEHRAIRLMRLTTNSEIFHRQCNVYPQQCSWRWCGNARLDILHLVVPEPGYNSYTEPLQLVGLLDRRDKCRFPAKE